MTEAPPVRVVQLSGPLVLQEAETVHARLTAALETAAALEIDCTGASEVDLSFVQLLLAARNTARARGVGLCLRGPAQGALREVLVRGGFLDPAGRGLPEAQFWDGKQQDA